MDALMRQRLVARLVALGRSNDRIGQYLERLTEGEDSPVEDQSELGRASGSVGGGYSVELTVWRFGMRAQWTPAVPRALTSHQIDRYKRIRDRALRRASATLGAPVLVVDA
jgi:hypothetical protein